MNLDSKEFNFDDAEFQLNQKTLNSYKNSTDILIQTLWDQIESNDKFAL